MGCGGFSKIHIHIQVVFTIVVTNIVALTGISQSEGIAQSFVGEGFKILGENAVVAFQFLSQNFGFFRCSHCGQLDHSRQAKHQSQNQEQGKNFLAKCFHTRASFQ